MGKVHECCLGMQTGKIPVVRFVNTASCVGMRTMWPVINKHYRSRGETAAAAAGMMDVVYDELGQVLNEEETRRDFTRVNVYHHVSPFFQLGNWTLPLLDFHTAHQ